MVSAGPPLAKHCPEPLLRLKGCDLRASFLPLVLCYSHSLLKETLGWRARGHLKEGTHSSCDDTLTAELQASGVRCLGQKRRVGEAEAEDNCVQLNLSSGQLRSYLPCQGLNSGFRAPPRGRRWLLSLALTRDGPLLGSGEKDTNIPVHTLTALGVDRKVSIRSVKYKQGHVLSRSPTIVCRITSVQECAPPADRFSTENACARAHTYAHISHTCF